MPKSPDPDIDKLNSNTPTRVPMSSSGEPASPSASSSRPKLPSGLHAARLKGFQQQQALASGQRRRSSGESDTAPAVLVRDHLAPAREATGPGWTRQGTGVVYDMDMVNHYSPWDTHGHPERPERFTSILQRCHELGLLERCLEIPSRQATETELGLLHSAAHIQNIKDICSSSSGSGSLEAAAAQYDSVYFNSRTFELARLAAGSTIDLVKGILAGSYGNGMGIVRPPGHHAMTNEPCGYCFFNNVGLAAKVALEQASGAVKRILIIDWDVHHGQATQQSFYDDPRVLYFSTHRYEDGLFWPNLRESNWNWIGGPGAATGSNVNVPLNKVGLGNSEFLALWYQVLVPMAYKFNPDLVLVSAGYDAALGCPEGEMCLSPQVYPHLLSPLLGLASGKVAVILEGGYCLKSLAEGAALTLRALLGDSCPRISPLSLLPPPDPAIVSTILSVSTVLHTHKPQLTSLNCCLGFLDDDDEGDEWTEMKLQDRVHVPQVVYKFTGTLQPPFPTRDCHPVQSMETILALDNQLDHLQATTDLKIGTCPQVGLVYDDAMLAHRSYPSPHPECPERISNIWACHGNYGLIERCHRIEAKKATKEQLLSLHTEKHVQRMENTSKLSQKELQSLGDKFNSIFLNPSSWNCGLLAAGSTIQAVEEVVMGRVGSAVAIVRPPGHHAEANKPYGFCLFNNVALGAKWALDHCGVKRILIVDWDVHHGNGIQRMFYSDPRVLYVSIHRYDHGSFFPCSSDGDWGMIGDGPGKGYNVNIPWNSKGMGDTEYLSAFTNVVLPLAYEFGPELVLVSAGFDAAIGDPLGGCKVSPEGYAHMTHLLRPLANGRTVLVLEGGYNLTSISYSMSLCTKALLGDPLPRLSLNDQLVESAVDSIKNTLRAVGPFWKLIGTFVDGPFLPPPAVVRAEIQLGQYEKFGAEGVEGLMEKLSLDQENANLGAAGATDTSSTFRIQVELGPEAGGGGFAVYPLTWCPHLEAGVAGAPPEINVSAPCEECGSTQENWICLTCYKVYCSRYVREHMLSHYSSSGHALVLSLADLSSWCFGCEDYVDHPSLKPPKDRAYQNKFGSDGGGTEE